MDLARILCAWKLPLLRSSVPKGWLVLLAMVCCLSACHSEEGEILRRAGSFSEEELSKLSERELKLLFREISDADIDPEFLAKLGTEAPGFELKNLEGKSISLASHRGKEIVILDMWATWCGPCVAELPVLTGVADKYRDKGVVTYAVNQQESKKEVEAFVKENDLTLPVLLDSEGEVGDAYGVQGIPMLVIIGKDGRIQSIHVGFSSQLKRTLEKELDQLVAGKDLSETVKDLQIRQKAISRELDRRSGFRQIWKKAGRYAAVRLDPKSGELYTLSGDGECEVFNSDGESHRKINIEGDGGNLKLARLRGTDQMEILRYDHWGRELTVHDARDGAKLWEQSFSDGIDDIDTADLDGDGLQEVIVGCNGFGGLSVYRGNGKRLWKNSQVGNVWSVSSVPDEKGSGRQVISTSAEGKVFQYGETGKKQIARNPLYYNHTVISAKLSPEDSEETLLSCGSTIWMGGSMAAMGQERKAKWRLSLPKGFEHCRSMELDWFRPWCLLTSSGGGLLIVDAAAGKILGERQGQGNPLVNAAWVSTEAGNAPRFAIANREELSVYEFTPTIQPETLREEPETDREEPETRQEEKETEESEKRNPPAEETKE